MITKKIIDVIPRGLAGIPKYLKEMMSMALSNVTMLVKTCLKRLRL